MKLKPETIEFIRAEHTGDTEKIRDILNDEAKHAAIISDLKNLLANFSQEQEPRREPRREGGRYPTGPRTEEERERRGFVFKSRGNCRDCGTPFEWWTTPKGKTIPLDLRTHIAHFETCKEKR